MFNACSVDCFGKYIASIAVQFTDYRHSNNTVSKRKVFALQYSNVPSFLGWIMFVKCRH